MVLKIKFENSFRRDLQKAFKQHKDISKIFNVASLIANNSQLPISYENHKLEGKYDGFWECHIEPDWLLIYSFDEKHQQVIFYRLGSHSELFG